jgi:hypothetical protein
MNNLDNYEILFTICALCFQVLLVIHFTLRRWIFNLAMRFGKIVYALSIPATIASLILLLGKTEWALWLGGFIYLAWATFGYIVEYGFKVEWRNSWRWSILIPYVTLYLATAMFYWWPFALIYKPLWYVCAVLFILSTYLNVTSHKRFEQLSESEKIS